MPNEVQAFENKHLAIMTAIAIHTQQEKALAEKSKEMKAELEKQWMSTVSSPLITI